MYLNLLLEGSLNACMYWDFFFFFFLSAAVIKELSLWLKVSAGVRRL